MDILQSINTIQKTAMVLRSKTLLHKTIGERSHASSVDFDELLIVTSEIIVTITMLIGEIQKKY